MYYIEDLFLLLIKGKLKIGREEVYKRESFFYLF